MNIHREEVMKFLKEKKVLTTSELARQLKISWNTAEKMLLELVIDGKLERLKKLGVNLWIKK